MNVKYGIKATHVFTIFFMLSVAYLIGCSGGAVQPTSPDNLLILFTAAMDANDETKAESICTKEFWNEKRNSGKRFYKQANRKKFQLKKNDTRTKGDKAVLVVDILREGKVVDQVFFYTFAKNNRWLIDGMDENRRHVDLYLEGSLPGRFYPADYPADKELEELGAKLIGIAGPLKEAVTDPEKQKTLLNGVLTGAPGVLFNQLRLLREVGQLKLKVVSTHMVDSVKRGAIVIHDESGKEKVFIYVAKEAGGWKLVNCHSGWLSAESIL
ncbi:MAG: hypothetical protein GY757_54310 [bacterium]|nr:hypothetical protein [bacterium]